MATLNQALQEFEELLPKRRNGRTSQRCAYLLDLIISGGGIPTAGDHQRLCAGMDTSMYSHARA